MIGVFLVDSSAQVRQAFEQLLRGNAEVTLLGSAPNALFALPALRERRPDVLLLDMEGPGLRGVAFLRQLLQKYPIPTVVFAGLSREGSRVAIEALSAGVRAVVPRPRIDPRKFLEESGAELIQTLKAAACKSATAGPAVSGGRESNSAVTRRLQALEAAAEAAPEAPILVGCSTGGTHAVERILRALPENCPGIAIVQHMPEKFTAAYAERLDGLCRIEVREARDGDRLRRGLALIAPGGLQMYLARDEQQGGYRVSIRNDPPINHHKPSVDALFESAAGCVGRAALAVLLTGMGADGARGMKRLHDQGVRTIAQDEETCVVFGMPREAINLGAVDHILPINRVAAAILAFGGRSGRQS